MKKMILFMCFGLLLSCSGDDDNKGNVKLTGTWSMTTYLNMVDGPITIEDGVFWTFDTQLKEVTVINNKDDKDYLVEAGTYNIKISGNKLTVIRPTYNTDLKFTINGNELTMESYEMIDSPIAKFKRMLVE
ncbi:hypothetical protein D3C87_349300 [compost metagenome]